MTNFAQMSEEQFKQFIMELLKRKEVAFEYLAKDFSELERLANGLKAVIPSLDVNKNEENTRQQLKCTMQILATQSLIIQRLIMLQLIHIANNDFDSEVAHVANRLGMGQEALQVMWKKKLGGK